jgi:uncharacterized membrane protein
VRWALVALEVTNLVLLVFFRPHRRMFDNVCVILSQFAAFYALILAVTTSFVTIAEEMQIFMLFILEGLLLLVVLLYFFRIGLVYNRTISKWRKDRAGERLENPAEEKNTEKQMQSQF